MSRPNFARIVGLFVICWLCPLDAHSQTADHSPRQNTPSQPEDLSVSEADSVSGFDILAKAIPDANESTSAGGFSLFSQGGNQQSMMKTAATLVLVVSLFLLFVFVTRKKGQRRQSGLPTSVVQVLGQMPLDAHQQLRLIRMGEKILLVASTQNQSQTLSEITDPQEVLRVVAQCQGGQWPDLPVGTANTSAATSRRAQRGNTLLEA